MTKVIFLFAALTLASATMSAQTDKFGLKLEVGGGADATKSAARNSTVWQLQVSPEYRFNEQFAAGVGIGATFHKEIEKGLGYSSGIISPKELNFFSYPVYAHVTYTLPMKNWKPFLLFKAGYTLHRDSYSLSSSSDNFATIKVNGGLYLSPSIGVKKQIMGNHSLLLSLSYELQDFYHTGNFSITTGTTKDITEKVSRNNIVLRVGWEF